MGLNCRQRATAERAAKRLFQTFQVSFKTKDTVDTPKRIVKAYEEIFARALKPEPDFSFTRFDRKTDQLVVEKHVSFFSVCEHHFLPYFGVCHVGYLPDKHIVGLSKIPRLVKWLASAPSTQESLTEEIAAFIEKRLKPRCTLVMLEATHLCMSMRGVKEPFAKTITHAIRGDLAGQLKEEFLTIVNMRGS